MRPLTGYVAPYPLISDLFKNSSSLAVVTEIINRRLFAGVTTFFKYHHLFEPTVPAGGSGAARLTSSIFTSLTTLGLSGEAASGLSRGDGGVRRDETGRFGRRAVVVQRVCTDHSSSRGASNGSELERFVLSPAHICHPLLRVLPK
jgi:hypothetical protein